MHMFRSGMEINLSNCQCHLHIPERNSMADITDDQSQFFHGQCQEAEMDMAGLMLYLFSRKRRIYDYRRYYAPALQHPSFTNLELLKSMPICRCLNLHLCA